MNTIVHASKSKTSQTFFRLLQLAKPEKKFLILGTIFLFLSSGGGLLFPQGIRTFVDNILSKKDEVVLNQFIVLVFILLIIQAIASALRYYFFTLAGERIVLDLRHKFYTHLLNLDISFFDENRTGSLLSRLSSDATILQNAVSVNISMGVRHLLGTLGGLALMFYTSPILALSMILIIPPIVFGALNYGKKIKKASKNSQDALALTGHVAEETISNMRTVKSFTQEFFEQDRYFKKLQFSLTQVKEKVFQFATFMGFASLFGYLAIVWVLWKGGHQVFSGELSVGDLTQFLIYLLMVAFFVGSLGSLWGDFMSAVGAANRIFEILDTGPKVDNEKGIELSNLKGHLKLTQIKFSYPARKDITVFECLNLELFPGTVTALVGISGSGKSTISSLISRFYDPDFGSIVLDGTDYKKLKPLWLRKQIALVAQEPILISDSIEENIRYGKLEATNSEVKEAARLANAAEFIEKFPEGYGTIVGERGIQLSGGQKQRVAIARALLKNPKILILDEATSALDSASEELVQEALARLMKGRTTLVIAHRLATIKNVDRICVLEKGNIVQSGTHDELIAMDGPYKWLVQKQLNP